jgi:hypothetical protein
MSGNPNGDRGLDSSLNFDTSAGIRKGDFEGDDQTSTSNSWPTRHERSPRSSRRESSPVGQGAMFDAGNQSSSSDTQQPQKHFPLSYDVEEFSRSTSPGSSQVVIAAIQDSWLSIVGELGPPGLQPFDLNIDIQILRHGVAEEDTHIEVDTNLEINPINSATLQH